MRCAVTHQPKSHCASPGRQTRQSCPLTPRHIEILQRSLDNDTTESAELAEILCCSPETLNDEWEELVDRMGIVRKRGKHKRTAALTQAIKRGCVRVKPDSGGEQADPEQQKNPQ